MGVLHIATEAVMMKGIVRETRKTDEVQTDCVVAE
jgi:hypothetical protein